VAILGCRCGEADRTQQRRSTAAEDQSLFSARVTLVGKTNEFGMIRFLKNTLGLGSSEIDANTIATPIELTADSENFQCEVESVSAGGFRLTPSLEAEVGATILYPQIRTELGGNRGLGLGAHAARGSVVVRLG
jgi:hypothetical protein